LEEVNEVSSSPSTSSSRVTIAREEREKKKRESSLSLSSHRAIASLPRFPILSLSISIRALKMWITVSREKNFSYVRGKSAA